MNKQLIKLLVLGLAFATVGNTMLAVKEPKQVETKSMWNPVNWFSEDEAKSETKKVVTDGFCTRNKTALIWTGSVVAGLSLATAAVLYFDLFGMNDKEDEEETTEK